MKYPSDITREQFNNIAPILESARKKTRPRSLDLYDIFNGVMYVVSSGCQWRMVPKDYPNFRSLHAYFRKWSEVSKEDGDSILDKVLKKISRRRAYEKSQETLNQHGYC
jgi:transposase